MKKCEQSSIGEDDLPLESKKYCVVSLGPAARGHRNGLSKPMHKVTSRAKIVLARQEGMVCVFEVPVNGGACHNAVQLRRVDHIYLTTPAPRCDRFVVAMRSESRKPSRCSTAKK